ncbi:MAG: T9SS type A sorting domain-containing protein [Bacteroidota bacterium]
MKQFFTLCLVAMACLSVCGQMATVTFAVDMNGVDGTVDAAFVAGEFQNWTPADGALEDADMNGVWSRTYELAPGTYLYKFGQGNNWGMNEGGGLADCGVDDNNGGFNRQITLADGDNIIVNFKYDSCEDSELSFDGKVALTLGVDMTGETGFDAVFVAGEFQGWMPGDGALADEDGDGIWTRTYRVFPGATSLYKFGKGDNWGDNEGGGLADCGEDDNNGGFNRRYTVPDDGSTEYAIAFKYNGCEEVQLTSTTNLSTLGTVSLAPNPMVDFARINFDNTTNATHDVFVTSMSGQVVRQYQGVRGSQLDIERGNLRAGLYFVTFRNDRGEMGSLKLMVQ